MQQRASMLYRLAWFMWLVGVVLVLVSWNNSVSALFGWFGLGLTALALLMTGGLRLYARYGPALEYADLQHPWAALLPDASSLPAELKLVGQGIITNEAMARQSKDAATKQQIFERWGRDGSIYRYYRNPRGGHAPNQLFELNLQIIHFQQPDGAQQMLHSRDAEHESRFSHYQQEPGPAGVGDDATLGRFISPGDSRLTTIVAGVELMFRRGPFVGAVVASAVQGALAALDLQSFAVGLAQDIDQRILAGARDIV
jgi:hypothetical protein